LAKRIGELVEQAELVDRLWRGDWLVGHLALRRLFSEIRSATGNDPKKPTLIQTVPHRGTSCCDTMVMKIR
jgi:DNA-binding winged helix-turn-helix (wHTH) protein